MKDRSPSLLSRTLDSAARPFRSILTLSLIISCSLNVVAQNEQLQISDFAVFAGAGLQGATVPTGPGYAVQLGSSSNINGGSVGSLKLVKTTGTTNITGNVFSK